MINSKVIRNCLKVHFIGIGGVSMSGLARYLKNIGFSVSGSDIASSYYTKILEDEGIKVYIGHCEDNVCGADVVVYSSAVKEDNPELKYAVSNNKYVLKRSDLLRMVSELYNEKIGVAGCHGKTTATCMLAHIFDAANMEFGAHIGGHDNTLGNFVAKGNKYFISEICEYKKNISNFTPDIAVVLNIEADHMDCYNDLDELSSCYFEFLNKAKYKIVCADDTILMKYDNSDKITFGFSDNADYKAESIVNNDGYYSFEVVERSKRIFKIKLNILGKHNILNALAAIAAARTAGIKPKDIKRGLKNFTGIRRRFEKIGILGGAQVIADYAHHPKQISLSVASVRQAVTGKLFAVFQPHTYSRTIYLKDEFVKVLKNIDNLFIYKTYPAREEYMEGGSAKELYDMLPNASGYYENMKDLKDRLISEVGKGDVILVLGAGDIYDLFSDELKQIK